MDALKGSSKRIHAMANLGSPVGFGDGSVVLSFPAGYGFHAEQCGTERSQDIFGGAFEQVLGVRPRLRCVIEDGDDTPPAVGENETAARHAAEAQAVAETEAAERAGDLPDDDTVRRRAVELVERDLGGQVLDVDGPSPR
jgi:hypothetical protein